MKKTFDDYIKDAQVINEGVFDHLASDDSGSTFDCLAGGYIDLEDFKRLLPTFFSTIEQLDRTIGNLQDIQNPPYHIQAALRIQLDKEQQFATAINEFANKIIALGKNPKPRSFDLAADYESEGV